MFRRNIVQLHWNAIHIGLVKMPVDIANSRGANFPLCLPASTFHYTHYYFAKWSSDNFLPNWWWTRLQTRRQFSFQTSFSGISSQSLSHYEFDLIRKQHWVCVFALIASKIDWKKAPTMNGLGCSYSIHVQSFTTLISHQHLNVVQNQKLLVYFHVGDLNNTTATHIRELQMKHNRIFTLRWFA